jgi:hypothetical protein
VRGVEAGHTEVFSGEPDRDFVEILHAAAA